MSWLRQAHFPAPALPLSGGSFALLKPAIAVFPEGRIRKWGALVAPSKM
jgi:hypothetical protein